MRFKMKRFLGILLSLVMVLGMLPGMTQKVYAETSEWNTSDSLPTSPGDYKLTTDIILNSTWTVPSGTITLDLNGHGIKMNGSNYSAIKVGSGSTLYLNDSDSSTIHKYSIPNPASNGAGLAVVNDSLTGGYQTFTGGYITGANKPSAGGGVLVDSGTFIMNGGTIIGNQVSGNGGGVRVTGSNGSFTMNGGSILGNKNDSFGGAISIGNGSSGNKNTVTINEGLIQYNWSGGNGGAIHTDGSYIELVITGGKIISNHTNGKDLVNGYLGGGLIRANGTTLKISGAPVIKDNTCANTSPINNIHLGVGKSEVIDLSSHLSSGADISVYVFGWSNSSTNDAKIAINAQKDDIKYISSDNPEIAGIVFCDGTSDYIWTGTNFSTITGAHHTHAANTIFLSEEAKHYTVTYEGNGNDGGSAPFDSNRYGSGNTVTVLGNTGSLAKTGYVFSGWNTLADGTGTNYSAGNTFSIAENTALYAKWKVIDANAPTISTQPRNLNLTYGYTEGSVNVTATAEEGYTLSYQWYFNTTASNENGMVIDGATAASYTIPIRKNAGTTEYYYCVVTATRTDNRQTASTTSNVATVTVNKANAVAATVTANNRTYDRTDKPLVTVDESSLVGGEMYYALGTDATTEPDASSYTTSIPAVTDAGSYYVWYMVKGNANHEDTEPDVIEVDVYQKVVSLTWDETPLVYNGKAQYPTATIVGLVEGDTCALTYDVYSEDSYPDTVEAIDAGEYSVLVYAENENYRVDFDDMEYEFEIKPLEVEVVWPEAKSISGSVGDTYYYCEFTYNGQQQCPTATAEGVNGKKIDLTISGSAKDASTFEYDTSYEAVASTNDTNYFLTNNTIDFYILPKYLHVEWDETLITYNGQVQYPTAVISGGIYEGDTCNIEYYFYDADTTDELTETVNAGEYIVCVGVDNDNYDTYYPDYEYYFEILKADSTATAPTAKTDLIYNGSAQELISAGSTKDGTMQYALGTNAEIAPTEGWSTSIPAETDAGTYYVWYRVVGDNNHSDVGATCVSVDIAKAVITITADDKSSKKGAELQELSWQVSGDYVSGDELGISASTTADSSADEGVYPITVSWNDNANYEATLISGKYTITAPEESGRVETKTIVADNVPSCSISNLTTELARSLATQEELIRVQNGENLLIYLDVENIDDSVSATDKSLVEAAVKMASKDAKVGMYLDLTLYKKVGDGVATKVTDTKESRISVTIEVPDSLKGGSDVTRTFYIIRVHDGATDILATTTETTITFETDKFSTYALAYSDKSNSSPDDNSSSSDGNSNSSQKVTMPAQPEKAPKTGDNFPSVWLWALILAGGLVPVGYAGGRHKRLERK